MYSRVLSRAAFCGTSANTAVRSVVSNAPRRSAAAILSGNPSKSSSTASGLSSRWVAARGQATIVSLAGGREGASIGLARVARRQPEALWARGQSASSPIGGRRHLSSQEGAKAEGAQEDDNAEGTADGQGESDEEGGGLRAELETATAQLKDTREKAMYLAAEMENVRAIAKRDADSARLYAVQKFAKQLLDVADNLERAVESAKEAGEAGGDSSHDVLLQGVEMTSSELQKVFRSQGLEKYGEGGDKFDPHLHDAMFEFADPDQEPGTVGQVLKHGYTLHGRVIRAAQVGTVKET